MTARSRARLVRFLFAIVAPGVLVLLCAGCAAPAARVYQRERLVDRIMSFDAQAKADARRMKSFEAREGSTGGGGGKGGGCACN